MTHSLSPALPRTAELASTYNQYQAHPQHPGSNFMGLSGTSVFLQTGHGCLGTLNCPSLMVQEWALSFQGCLVLVPFKDWSHLHWRNVDYQGECQPQGHRGSGVLPFVCFQGWHLLPPHHPLGGH